MPQIAHFQVKKWKSSLPWEGGHPSAGRYFDNIEIRQYENNIEYPIMISWLFRYIAETRYHQNIVDIDFFFMIHWPKMSLSPIGEAAILIMEAAILDGGTRNEPIAVAPIARIECGYATPAAAVYLQCITVQSIYKMYKVQSTACICVHCDVLQIDRSRRSVSTKDCIITRQESAQKMWGLRTTVHEDWNGS